MSLPTASLLLACCALALSPAHGATAKARPAAKPKTEPRAEPATPSVPLEPALEPHAERYAAGVAALTATRQTEVAQRRAAYLAELDASLTKLNATSDAALLGALKKERAGIADGLVVPANPASLPPEIQAARKQFFNRVEFATMTFAAEKKKIDDAYLKLLATLARQTKGDKALALRIALEKRRVLTGE